MRASFLQGRRLGTAVLGHLNFRLKVGHVIVAEVFWNFVSSWFVWVDSRTHGLGSRSNTGIAKSSDICIHLSWRWSWWWALRCSSLKHRDITLKPLLLSADRAIIVAILLYNQIRRKLSKLKIRQLKIIKKNRLNLRLSMKSR